MNKHDMICKFFSKELDKRIEKKPQDGQGCPACVVTPTPELTPEDDQLSPVRKNRFLYVLDSGHGPLTEGKRSPVYLEKTTPLQSASGRLLEYRFNRDINARLGILLGNAGIKYAFTLHQDGIHGNSLRARVKAANQIDSGDLDKLFISVHGNAGPASSIDHWAKRSASGMETWYHTNSSKGEIMAGIFQNTIMSELRSNGIIVPDRGIKYHENPRESFYVLRKTEMPAILTENLFFNNKYDIALMLNDSVRNVIAIGHYKAIMYIEKNGLTLAA